MLQIMTFSVNLRRALLLEYILKREENYAGRVNLSRRKYVRRYQRAARTEDILVVNARP
jgi:hypothetical protein